MPASSPTPEPAGRRASRLTPSDSARLRPWQKAVTLESCHLYWLPVQRYPVPTGQKLWQLRFMDLLTEKLKADYQLRCEIFLQQKIVVPLMDAFVQNAREFGAMQGLSRRPGAPLPPVPSEEDIAAFQKGEKQFDINQFSPDYCYWFIYKDPRRQRELFGGFGGLTNIFLKADPNAVAPELPLTPGLRAKFPMFQMVNLDKIFAGAVAMNDSFLSKSKQLFGEGIANTPQFSGMLFVLPLLQVGDFFDQHGSELKNWFEVFDVYLNESPVDGGVMLASRLDLDECLAGLLDTMASENLEYPGG